MGVLREWDLGEAASWRKVALRPGMGGKVGR
jgi:hypothetical protein